VLLQERKKEERKKKSWSPGFWVKVDKLTGIGMGCMVPRSRSLSLSLSRRLPDAAGVPTHDSQELGVATIGFERCGREPERESQRERARG